jgi:hypothetical protein
MRLWPPDEKTRETFCVGRAAVRWRHHRLLLAPNDWLGAWPLGNFRVQAGWTGLRLCLESHYHALEFTSADCRICFTVLLLRGLLAGGRAERVPAVRVEPP